METLLREIRALTDRVIQLEADVKTMSLELHSESTAKIDYIAACDYPEMIEEGELTNE